MPANLELLSVEEAARHVGCTGGRIRQLLIAGDLHGEKIGNVWVIPAHEAERLRKNPAKKGRPVGEKILKKRA